MSITENHKQLVTQSLEAADEQIQLQQKLAAIQERHRLLTSVVPKIEECTGIIYHMIYLEKEMDAIQKRLAYLRSLQPKV